MNPAHSECLETRILLTADFGDAVAPYPVTQAEGGAEHTLSNGLQLGASVDAEADGIHSVLADADGADDDGVTFGLIRPGALGATATVNVQGAAGKLDAWIDFNGDGSWGGPGEQIAASRDVAVGDNVLAFDVPGWAQPGASYARFRLSSAGGLGTGEVAADGEVEDYQVDIADPAGLADFADAVTIGSPASGHDNVRAADLDGDGDMDVLTTDFFDDTISWFENDGSRNFTEHTVSTLPNGPTDIAVADVDGDGDMDIVGSSSLDGRVSWYENDGNQNFTRHTVSSAFGPFAVFTADMDGDGDIDVLSANANTLVNVNSVAWYENDGSGSFSAHGINTTRLLAGDVFAADINRDGHMDVVSASSQDDTIAWYMNDGNQSFSEQIITTVAQSARELFAADLDDDGDPDIVAAAPGDGRLFRYVNDGNGNFTRIILLNSTDSAADVFAADLNADGVLDIVSVTDSGLVAWYDQSSNYQENVIDHSASASTSLFVADLNSEGSLDVLTNPAGTLAWYQNVLPYDFGDAPAPYKTTSADNGPRHDVVDGLHLGAQIDGEQDGQPNAGSTGDDIHDLDDEDAILSPLDLTSAIGAVPTVTLLATNQTTDDATLAGWIDYNTDGVFDDATERATINVPTGTTDGRFTLTFPAISHAFPGTTYARFRLSTDAAFVAAPTSTGTAADGEIEDYAFTITAPGAPTVQSSLKIGDGLSGLPAGLLDDNDSFGLAAAVIGDLDGDGVMDLAVGARNDENTGIFEGAVYVLFMNADGTVRTHQKISNGLGGLPAGSLDDGDGFGTDVTSLGDLDGDGVTDLAVGASSDQDSSGLVTGAVYVLFMNADGTVRTHQKISNGLGGLSAGTLAVADHFGASTAAIGDVDGDGVVDLAVGAAGVDNTNAREGAVFVLLMNRNGTVKSQQKISDGLGLPPGTLSDSDGFGNSVAALGDLNGDGVVDLAVGASGHDNFRSNEGAVYVLMLNESGSVGSHQIITDGIGGLAPGSLDLSDSFGSSVTALGDLDGDGVTDLVVGASSDDHTDFNEGAVYVLMLNSDGTVKSQAKIGDGLGGLTSGSLDDSDFFGTAVASGGDFDGDGVTDLFVGAGFDDQGGSNRGALWVLNLSPALDYGDAPDFAMDTATGDYRTRMSDGGPSHGINGVFLGATVDADSGTLFSVSASADDLDNALPDDEDGVLSPLDLLGTVGAAPTVLLQATNLSGTNATLAGWIDYNTDGVFDVSEQASVNVPAGTTDGRFTLTFPAIPGGSEGSTYARFRLSTDAGFVAAPSSIGPAADGEVEDYPFGITISTDRNVQSHVKLSNGIGGLPAGLLDDNDDFGSSVTSLGDLDGDGINDLAVGAESDENGEEGEGAVYILFMNADGTVRTSQKISDGMGGLPTGSLHLGDRFGSAVASLGDLDGDGVTDLAVGARLDITPGIGQPGEGAVFVLFLNSDGTVKSHQKLGDGIGGLPSTLLDGMDQFGSSVTSLGDLDGDGVVDLAVGAAKDENVGIGDEGAVYILFLNPDGTVNGHRKIGDGLGLPAGSLGNGDEFGSSVSSLGDLDGDGVIDLAVGAAFANEPGSAEGAVYVLLLNPDGSVRSHRKIANNQGGLPAGTLDSADRFGTSVAAVGDLDADGVTDLAVGAYLDEHVELSRGAVYLLMMNSDGTVRNHQKISDGLGGLQAGSLDTGDGFGGDVASLGDLNGDGVIELAVGAPGDENTGLGEGAVWLLNLAPVASAGQVAHVVGRDSATGDWWVARSDGNSFTNHNAGFWAPTVGWLDVNTADVNGDGLGDVVGRDPSSGDWWVGLADAAGNFTNQNWGVWASYVTWLDVRIADVNGDGNDDIVGRQQSNGNWWVAVSDGVGGFANQNHGFWDPTVTWLDVNVADVNGDGNDDVVGRQQSNGNWWVAVSDGLGSFTNQLWGNWTPIPWVDVNIADVNGDGFDDVIGRQDSNGNWWVSVSDGAGSFTNQLWGNFAAIPWDDVTVADVNGDGNDDVVARQQSNGNWWVGLSDGVSAFTNQLWGYWAPSIAWVDVSFGDVDGDGDDDIIGREQSNGRWWVGRSDGAGSFGNELWGTWDPAVAWTDVALLDDLLAV